VPKTFIGDLSEGLIAFELNEKIGFMNTTGKVMIEPRFDTALPFTNQRSYVTIKNEQGYIDRTGEFIWRAPK
jgi:WG containing repeat